MAEWFESDEGAAVFAAFMLQKLDRRIDVASLSDNLKQTCESPLLALVDQVGEVAEEPIKVPWWGNDKSAIQRFNQRSNEIAPKLEEIRHRVREGKYDQAIGEILDTIRLFPKGQATGALAERHAALMRAGEDAKSLISSIPSFKVTFEGQTKNASGRMFAKALYDAGAYAKSNLDFARHEAAIVVSEPRFGLTPYSIQNIQRLISQQAETLSGDCSEFEAVPCIVKQVTERGEIRVAHTGAIQEEAAEEAMQRSNIEERQRTRLVNKIGTDSVMQQELVPALEAYANAKDGGDIEGMKRAIDTVLNAVVGAVQRAQRPGRGGPT